MTHLLILALGYVALLYFSVSTFYKIRSDSVLHVETHIPAVSFGTSIFGIIFLGYYLFTNKDLSSINTILVGVLWTSIINGIISCIIVGKQIEDRKGD